MCWDYLYPGFTVFKNHEPSIHHPAGHWSRLSGWLNFSSASSRKAWLWSCLVARKPAILIFLLLWDLTYQIWDITFYQIYIYIYIHMHIYIYTYGYHQRNIYIDIEKQPLVDHFTPVPMDSHVIFLKLIWDQLGMGMIIGRSSQTWPIKQWKDIWQYLWTEKSKLI